MSAFLLLLLKCRTLYIYICVCMCVCVYQFELYLVPSVRFIYAMTFNITLYVTQIIYSVVENLRIDSLRCMLHYFIYICIIFCNILYCVL
jgi:hypothetical protein